jgi:hypothetical protein
MSDVGQDRRLGELVVDVVLVVGIACYLIVARAYPADGRQIPTVVGIIALIAAAVQLIGWFVPGMRTFTHGADTSSPSLPTLPPGSTASVARAGVDTDQQPSSDTHQTRDTVVIMAWSGGFLGAILALGYVYGVPLFFLAYFGSRRSWKLAIVSAVVMWALARFVFIGLLTIPLPSGAWL